MRISTEDSVKNANFNRGLLEKREFRHRITEETRISTEDCLKKVNFDRKSLEKSQISSNNRMKGREFHQRIADKRELNQRIAGIS